MSDFRNKAAIVASATALVAGGLWMLEPPNPRGPVKPVNQQVEELDDANGQQADRNRDSGNDGLNAEDRERVRSGEHRPRMRIIR
ncbi:hypothetical protein ACFQNE_13835 [Gordonia phosphorivorans]|uniref:Uncharacterized protein n=1 Tax=Gordonia phosphorivorans TaxID=1056982 RepID=A0ABV6HCB3_9ACTN